MILRPATPADSDAVADVYLRAWAIGMPFVANAHTDEQVRTWLRQRVLPEGRTIVAEAEGAIVGMLAHSEDAAAFWIDQLYVDPAWSRRGVGSALLRHALTLVPRERPVRLYSFQANTPARHFYERHGFTAIAFGDGSGNEERCPDILYERKR